MIKTTRQLKDKIRNLSGGNSKKAQALLRNYIMERFLERVSVSEYNNRFVLKGGMFVSSLVGIDTRATMDIDSTIRSYPLNLQDIVSWCVGHLVGLANADVYDEKFKKWNIADLPISPNSWEFVVSEDKNEQFNILKQLMEDSRVTEVVNACDAGREGELIFRLVYNKADCTKPIKRLWISSMEETAILQ